MLNLVQIEVLIYILETDLLILMLRYYVLIELLLIFNQIYYIFYLLLELPPRIRDEVLDFVNQIRIFDAPRETNIFFSKTYDPSSLLDPWDYNPWCWINVYSHGLWRSTINRNLTICLFWLFHFCKFRVFDIHMWRLQTT